MRLDTVTAAIRPRSDWEAVDLGLAMVRRDFWRCLAVWWLAMLVPSAVAGWWLWDQPAWWLMLFWWGKPAGSRLVLFELSRRLFGERPSWRASLRRIPPAWTRRFGHRFVWARGSPWLPVMLAVEDLEGLTGKAYQQRRGQLTRRGESVVMWLYVTSELAACWFGLALLVWLLMFIPEGQDGAWRLALDSWDLKDPTTIPLLVLRTITCCVMLAISLTDVFVTGAGFGVYLNNRTWLEGWDVELAFKRLARRLAKVAMVVWLGWAVGLPATAQAEGGPEPVLSASRRQPPQVQGDPERWIREIKADEAFQVHTVIDKVPKPATHSLSWEWPQWLSFGRGAEWPDGAFTVAVLTLIGGVIVWVLWHNRQVWRRRSAAVSRKAVAPAARVVLGMEVSPESLPDNVPGAAWALWQQDRPHAALGLLYRATISQVIQAGRVEIQESDTEGDCLRRVEQAGAAAQPEYFRGIAGAWSRLAYAGLCPEDREVEALCRQWPFVDRRGG